MRDWSDEFAYLRERIDNIVSTLANQDKTLARNTDSLEEHMRRTLAAEAQIEKLSEQMEVALWPIKAAKLLGVLGALIMFAWTIAYYWNQMVRP